MLFVQVFLNLFQGKKARVIYFIFQKVAWLQTNNSCCHNGNKANRATYFHFKATSWTRYHSFYGLGYFKANWLWVAMDWVSWLGCLLYSYQIYFHKTCNCHVLSIPMCAQPGHSCSANPLLMTLLQRQGIILMALLQGQPNNHTMMVLYSTNIAPRQMALLQCQPSLLATLAVPRVSKAPPA